MALLNFQSLVKFFIEEPTMFKAEDHREEIQEIAGVKVNVTSYRIGERHYCHVANADPGATIARAEAAAREEAVNLALTKARQRLKPAA